MSVIGSRTVGGYRLSNRGTWITVIAFLVLTATLLLSISVIGTVLIYSATSGNLHNAGPFPIVTMIALTIAILLPLTVAVRFTFRIKPGPSDRQLMRQMEHDLLNDLRYFSGAK